LSALELPPQFAEVTTLDPAEAVYRLSPPRMKSKFIAWITATIICGVIFAIGYFGESTIKQHGMEMVAVGALMLGAFGMVVVGGVWLLVLLGMWLLNLLLFANPQVIAVYRDGIANSEKGKLLAWPWSDIREVYTYVFVNTATSDTGLGCRFDIVHRDGGRFTFCNLVVGWNELMERVRREVYSRVGPEITRAFDGGQPVPFGKDLVVEREGVRNAKNLTPWDALCEYRLDRGMLVVRGQKSSAVNAPVASIPNLELLLALLERKLPEPK
jgi:hypothetical protein